MALTSPEGVRGRSGRERAGKPATWTSARDGAGRTLRGIHPGIVPAGGPDLRGGGRGEEGGGHRLGRWAGGGGGAGRGPAPGGRGRGGGGPPGGGFPPPGAGQGSPSR